ncbi:lipocalin-like domain-containing protein [Xanthomonas sp. Kuri4-2]
MKAQRWAGVASALLAAAVPVAAQAQESPLAGSWRLTGYQVESKDTGKMIPAMGEHPSGRVIFTEDHRVAFVLTGEGRKSGDSDAAKAALLAPPGCGW